MDDRRPSWPGTRECVDPPQPMIHEGSVGQRLREQVERMSEVERIVGFGSWTWEVASGRVQWSDELHRIYGLEPGSFPGTVEAFLSRLAPGERDRVWAKVARSVETLEPFSFEERILRPDGEERVLLSQGHVIAGPDGHAQTLVGVCHDVTDRARAERTLGATERRMRAIIDNTPSMISVKDLSGRYMMSNDESGRVLGLSADELVGRRCGDVFPPEVAEVQRENDQRAAATGQPVFDEAVLHLNGERRSFTSVTFPLQDDQGRPAEICTIVTDVTERKERESERRERLEWADRISSALGEERMVAFAQPVVDLRTGAQASRELLVRMWAPGDRAQLLAPAEFLPAAERFGLIQDIDAWMVGQALRLAADVSVQVNLSAVTIGDRHARREIIRLLERAPSAAARVVFEITETAAAQHLLDARAFADELTALGCRVALDDFGTGFGSFTYLRSLPLSHLKIDVSFVRGLAASFDDCRLVKSIIGMAREFGLQTIAEGVEDRATFELLRELGADYAQGFYLGRPAPLPD